MSDTCEYTAVCLFVAIVFNYFLFIFDFEPFLFEFDGFLLEFLEFFSFSTIFEYSSQYFVPHLRFGMKMRW